MPFSRLRAYLMPPAPDRAARRENLLRALPYLLALAVVAVVLVCGEKYWSTDDDSHMAMIAHGYGMTDVPSPGIVYSNVIWGWLVMHLGIGSIQGYSVGAYAAMLAACVALCWALYRGAAPAWAGAALLVMMFAPALINMQFTITAGDLAVAGLALALSARREDGPWPWLATMLLLLWSSLVRLDECLFVLLLAAPFGLARWHRDADPLLRRRAVAALSAAALLMGACAAVDHAYYSGPGWQSFRQMNALRRPFSDYGLTEYYAKYRAQLGHSDVSINDLRLIDQRAFLDTDFFTPARLQPLIDGVTADQRVDFNLHRWPEALRPLGVASASTVLLVLLFALVAGRRQRAAVAGALLLTAVMLCFWLWGRPGIVHIYAPAEAALAAFALLGMDWRFRAWLPLAGIALFAMGLALAWRVGNAARRESAHAAVHAQTACSLPDDQLLVVWGPAALRERHLYRPTSPHGEECRLQVYFINTLSLLPGTLDKLYGYTHGKPFIQALREGQAFHLLSDDSRIDMLKTYFKAHYGTELTAKPLALDGSDRAYLLQVTP